MQQVRIGLDWRGKLSGIALLRSQHWMAVGGLLPTGEKEVERNKLNSPTINGQATDALSSRKGPSDWFIVADLSRYWSID